MEFGEQKVIGQNWKQPACPSAKEYAKPVVHLHTMENCSARMITTIVNKMDQSQKHCVD